MVLLNRTAPPLGRLVGATLVAGLLLPGTVRAQMPHIGDVQKLRVITIAIQVGSTEKESKQVTYSPPPGWYVRSHAVHCAKKAGHSSFSVTTVPQNWSWLSEDKVTECYKALVELAARAKDAGLQAKFAHDRDAMLADLHKVRSSHHALVVDATARGEGLLRSGGGIELTVTAEIVYIGTDEDMHRTVDSHQAKLK